MGPATRFARLSRALSLVGSLAAAACFETGAGLTLPDLDATLVGRVEQTFAPAPGAEPPTADSVEAVSIAEAGNVSVVAEAAVATDGSYRLPGVPADRTRIQVIARTAAGVEVGRAPFHGETVADEEQSVLPITPETTVQGRVLAALRADGLGMAADDRGSVVLLVRMNDEEGSLVARADVELDAVAEALVSARAWTDAATGAVAPDVTEAARAELLAELAIDHAEARHAGVAAAEAHDALVEDALTGWAELGTAAPALASVTAARVTGIVRGSATGAEPTRLALMRQGVDMNLRARERLAASSVAAPGEAAAAVAQALVDARTAAAAATDLDALAAAVGEGAATAEAAIRAAVLTAAGPLDPAVHAEVEAALSLAAEAADLSALLTQAATTEEAAQVLAGYQGGVETAVGTLVELLPETTFDAEALARLLIAARGAGAFD